MIICTYGGTNQGFEVEHMIFFYRNAIYLVPWPLPLPTSVIT